MARRRREEEHENHERWLVSYADFITLLFAFFVVMYAISSVNEGKYKVLSNSLSNAFTNTTAQPGGQPIATIQGRRRFRRGRLPSPTNCLIRRRSSSAKK
ncbi:flagellar motor protein MotB [Dechloromonas sp. A34]|uniref:flagellar motor protein MotB n=1 Tax=Dechloromonas sp. A34 TaxID=447588 RepID=UPI002248C534|nr:flagellar motor protein MotB [Dechloromonas sp. A34]